LFILSVRGRTADLSVFSIDRFKNEKILDHPPIVHHNAASKFIPNGNAAPVISIGAPAALAVKN
jgi:hypothetical protein